MKWLPATGMVQMSADGRYCLQHPVEGAWVAYALSPYGTGDKLGERETETRAKALCIAHEAELYARRTA